MAEPRSVVDVVRSEQARDFLRDVVRFIRQPARGCIEGDAARVRPPQTLASEAECFFPANSLKAGLAAATQHWIRQAPEIAQFPAVQFSQPRDVRQQGWIEGGHRVQPQHFEANEAEMDAVHGVVVQPVRAQRTAVVNAVPQDPPSIGQVVAVFPDCAEDLGVMVRFSQADAKGHPTGNVSPVAAQRNDN